MSREVIGVGIAGLLVGAALTGLILAGPGLDPPAVVPATGEGSELDTLAAELRELERELDRERGIRAELESEVALLADELRRLAAREPEGTEPAEAPVGSHAEPSAPAPVGSGPGPGGLDSEALIAAGFRPAEVDAFRARLDEIELQRLYLRDRATREGWLNEPRYAEEVRALRQARGDTRDEFGDEFYDWMLYTTGHPNRIQISEVMEGSPAAAAGVEVGDVILRYGDRRIFSSYELRQGTVGGRAGETTALDVERDGERVRLYVPRGPLGVRVDAATRPPPPVR